MSANLYDALIAEPVARARSCIRRLPRARFCRHGKLAGSSATAVLYLNRPWAPEGGSWSSPFQLPARFLAFRHLHITPHLAIVHQAGPHLFPADPRFGPGSLSTDTERPKAYPPDPA